VQDHPKGCGCMVPGIDASALTWGAPTASIGALVALGLVSRRRRRR